LTIMTRIVVVGGGRIGEALVSGLVASGHDAAELSVAEPVAARADELTVRYGVATTAEVGAAVSEADVVVIAVKPGDVDNVVSDVAKAQLDSTPEQVLVSLAAGVPTARLEARLPAGYPVVRAMPNTPMLVGAAMSVIAPGRYARAQHLAQAEEMLRAVGAVLTLPEASLDAVTALSGSGPAYFFLAAEAMIDAGVSLGLTRDVATTLVSQTLVGAGAMLTRTGESPVELRAGVTSPGGTTAAALRVLERSGIRSAFLEALHASRDRSAELGG
jgi:pyrroline-5-carboxylate reductase